MPLRGYYAIIEPDEGEYTVAFPDIPEAINCGETLAEAVAMAEEALGLCLSVREDEGLETPEPTKPDTIKLKYGDSLAYIKVNTEDYKEAN